MRKTRGNRPRIKFSGKKLIPRSVNNDPACSGAGVIKRQLVYVSKLLRTYQLSLDLLKAALFCLDQEEISALLNSVYGPDSPDADCDQNKQYYMSPESIQDIDDLSRCIIEDLSAGALGLNESGLVNMLESCIERTLGALPERGCDTLDERISGLSSVFRFSPDEQELIAVLYSVFEVQMSYFKDLASDFEYYDLIKFMSVLSGVASSEVKRIMAKDGPLFTSGIINNVDVGMYGTVSFEPRISEYLSGLGDINLTERFVKKDRASVLPLENFSLPAESVRAVQGLLSDDYPCNILLAGVAGTGKTEFARSAARASGRPVFTLNVGGTERSRVMSLRHDEANTVYVSFRAAEEMVKSAGGVLIADEMDVMLNCAEKGWLNLFIDSSSAKIIWISNSIHWVEESTMRRFHYSLYFEKTGPKERAVIWKNVLAASPYKKIIKLSDINMLAREYAVNAGGIARALSNLERLEGPDCGRESALEKLEHFLEAHSMQIRRNFSSRKKALNSIDGAYDVSALNITENTKSLVDSLRSFARGLLAGGIKEGNINFLFSGAPGTGKTEFVKHLALESGLELIVKRHSDLVSAWVGETEKNIAGAFREAENAKAILFIDEADSLFTSREGASYSWEKSRTNELLTCMENFTGVFICASNRLPDIDAAAMRRFHWKAEFRPLRPEQRPALYRRFFGFVKKRVSAKQAERLRCIEGLTPGDMKAVREKSRYIGPLSHDDYISALEKEQNYKNPGAGERIGF